MVRKCGACAMLVNERPRLACYISTCSQRFYNHIGTFKQVPLVNVRSLTGRICLKFEKTEPFWQKVKLMNPWTHEPRYQSARCLMCGCCVGKCVLTSLQMGLSQALLLQSTFRILNEEQKALHLNKISAEYKKKYFGDAGSRYLVIFVRLVCLWKEHSL